MLLPLLSQLLSALGAYRVPHGNLNAYMLITGIKAFAGTPSDESGQTWDLQHSSLTPGSRTESDAQNAG